MKCINKFYWMGLLSVLASGCVENKVEQAEPLQDQPVAEYQIQLLDQAFVFATAIPLQPHVKDRARCQENAVTAALELDQPTRALKYADQIPNWRQGWAYASYALYSIEHGQTNGIASLLEKADEEARAATQDWRRERVWVQITRAWKALGCDEKAAGFGAALKESDYGAAELQKTTRCTEEEFDEYSAKLDEQITVGDLDMKKSALYSYTALYNCFYKNESRRELIENKIESGWNKVPYFDRVDLISCLADTALKHDNREDAVRLADKAGEIVKGTEWPAEYHMQLLAKLAKLDSDCGEPDATAARLESAMEIFNTEKDGIVDIFRTEALLPVAEAYAQIGDIEKAHGVYALAVEQAVLNPNSRPRAEDLCQILLSMATHSVDPDAALDKRIDEIKRNLGDPW